MFSVSYEAFRVGIDPANKQGEDPMNQTNPNVTSTPRDRRRGKRILTLRNAMIGALALLAIFTTVTMTSELRGTPQDEYGRLYQKRIPVQQEGAARPQPVVIEEAPQIADATVADPLRVETIQKEHYLGVNTATLDPRDSLPIDPAFRTEFEPERKLARGIAAKSADKSRFVITGGAGGVYTVVEE